MSLKKAVGFGILMWIIMFAVVSAILPWYGQYTWVKVVVILLSGLLSYVLAGYVHVHDAKSALGYAASWVILGILLDALVTYRFNSAVFGAWSLWAGYAATLFAPFLRIIKTKPQAAA